MTGGVQLAVIAGIKSGPRGSRPRRSALNATVSRVTEPCPSPENFSHGPAPVCKKVLALLVAEPLWDAETCAALEKTFGAIDYRGAFHPFEDGGYYAAEMGSPLHRGFLSFRGLADPGELAGWKHATRALEEAWKADGKRTRNLDVGYLDADKLVLASFKAGPRKIYLGKGVWADMVLGYSKGGFAPMPWTFPDFRSGCYHQNLGVIREKLKAEMRR
jgi:hypothetical protein